MQIKHTIIKCFEYRKPKSCWKQKEFHAGENKTGEKHAHDYTPQYSGHNRIIPSHTVET